MSKFWSNYGSTVLLLSGVVLGAAAGLAWGDAVNVVRPVGEIFLNFIFVLVVPLVIFSMSSSICRLQAGGKAGKVLGISLLVFLSMMLIAGILAYFAIVFSDPLKGSDIASVTASLPKVDLSSRVGGGDAVVSSLSVPEFGNLLTKAHLLPLILFSCLLGYGTALAGEKGKPFAAFLQSGLEVTMSMMSIIMRVAPLGLGCYFAVTVATLGSSLLGGYLRISVLYFALALSFFFVINPVYILISCGSGRLKAFWRHILPPSITAFSTCSSAAAMPGNIEAAKRMGVRTEVAESVIPFGTNIHKDGSVVSGVFKVVFLMLLFGQGITGPSAAFTIVGVALVQSVVVGAVTSGGMTGELLICSLLGLDPVYAGILVIFGTIVDIPSTLVNSSSNVVAAMLVDRFSGTDRQ